MKNSESGDVLLFGGANEKLDVDDVERVSQADFPRLYYIQCGPLSLVEAQRGSALIGRECC